MALGGTRGLPQAQDVRPSVQSAPVEMARRYGPERAVNAVASAKPKKRYKPDPCEMP